MLNFESVGSPTAIIKNNDSKRKGTGIFMSSPEEKDQIMHPFTEYELTNKEQKFELAVNDSIERQIIYVCGASGSGKSYWTRNYVEEYKKIYKNRPVYLFSALTEDDSIDKIKDLQRIALSKELITDELSSEDFKDSMIIFDDVDTVADRKIRKAILAIQASILQTGRHHNVSCVITSHVCCNGAETRLVLNESHAIVFFKDAMPARSLHYLLNAYMGMDKQQIETIKRSNGRATIFVKSSPRVCITQSKIFML